MATIEYTNPLTIKEQESTGLLILVDATGKRLARAELPTDLLNLAREKGVLTADLPAPTDPRLKNTVESNAVTTAPVAQPEPVPLTASQIQENVDATNAADVEASTNPSQTEAATLEKYQMSSVVDLSSGETYEKSNNTKGLSLERTVPGVPPGAEKPAFFPSVNVFDKKGNKIGKDLRVKLRVPRKYLDGMAEPLSLHQGILFPYTPQINYELKADYGSSAPVHTNFTIYFYQRSSIGPINIVGKFTVENENDAIILAATIHCLKSLTRMRFGGAKAGDIDSGAPPPVCRLDGHGDSILDNVPVVLQNFRIELPDNVDYFTLRTNYNQFAGQNGDYVTSFPTVSTINLTCLPIYSRNEMQNFSVTKYLNGAFKGQGII